jgi:hypothetical protein
MDVDKIGEILQNFGAIFPPVFLPLTTPCLRQGSTIKKFSDQKMTNQNLAHSSTTVEHPPGKVIPPRGLVKNRQKKSNSCNQSMFSRAKLAGLTLLRIVVFPFLSQLRQGK